MSLHIIAEAVGTWCSVSFQFDAEVFGLLYCSDEGVVVLRQLFYRVARCLG